MRKPISQFALALVAASLFSQAALAADTAKPVRVLASLPITYGLASVLLKNTDVQLEQAAPGNLPGSRQSAYFSGRGAPALQKLASGADAVIGLRALWPDDPLYPMARRSNIRIVEIDAARPVDGSLPGVALQPGAAHEGLNSQPWLASQNMGRMADVIAADLVRLAPAAKKPVDANLAALKQRLLKLSAESETALAQADNLTVFSLSERLGYLASGLNLDLLGSDSRADTEWSADALQDWQKQLQANDVKVVLAHREPAEPIKAAISAAGSQLLVLPTDSADPVAELEGNVGLLVKALTTAPSR